MLQSLLGDQKFYRMKKFLTMLALWLFAAAAFAQTLTFSAGSAPTNAPIKLISAKVVQGPVGSVIEQDVAFSNTNTIQVTGTIKDALGRSYSSVSNPGNYTFFTGDGRAYQFQIPVPAASKRFLSYVPGSLAYHLTTNELGLAARTGVDYSNYIDRINGVVPWAVLPTNLLTANINPNFWLKNIWGIQSESVGWGYGTDGSPVGLTTNFVSYFSAFALSPNAVLGTMDSGFGINTMICFVDWNSNLITRVVIAETNLPGENAILYILNSNLPPSIPPVYFMPTNLLSKIPLWTNAPNFGVKYTDLVYHSQYNAFLAGGLSAFSPGNLQYSIRVTRQFKHPELGRELLVRGLLDHEQHHQHLARGQRRGDWGGGGDQFCGVERISPSQQRPQSLRARSQHRTLGV